jgi:hypothetical protein
MLMILKTQAFHIDTGSSFSREPRVPSAKTANKFPQSISAVVSGGHRRRRRKGE